MKLTFQQIRSIAFGAVSVREESDRVRFFKCTDRQAEVWNRARADLGERAFATSGVRLDFHTDSERLSFRAVSGRKYDLLINGKIAERVRCTDEEINRVHSFDLPKGEKRVTLVFPSHSVGSIADVELADGATFAPHRHACKILFLGDSITQGWNSKDDSASFAWRVTLALNADSIINGIGGAIFLPDSVERVNFAPDMTIVAYGTNDVGWHKTPESYEAQAEETLKRVAQAYPKSRLVALTPIWRGRGDEEKVRPVGTIPQVRALIESAARRQGFEVIDGLSLVPHDPALYADGWLHPNDEGFAFYAERLIAALERRA